jgi:hypothetical protein
VRHFLLASVGFLFFGAVMACSSGDFSGSSGQVSPAKKKTPVDKIDAKQPDSTNDNPQLKTDDGGGQIITPNLTQCAELPLAGKTADGKCGANSVVVIVDDGSSASGGMTCCPIGSNTLSAKPEEKHIVRTQCAANEVATGISRPSFFCTKINTDFFVLEPPTSSILLNNQTSITALERSIASSYDNLDACVCRTPSVVIGPHSQQNDTCAEKCAVIKRK